MTFPYTEDTLVQQITAESLENELGWDSVYAFDRDGSGLLARFAQMPARLATQARMPLRQRLHSAGLLRRARKRS